LLGFLLFSILFVLPGYGQNKAIGKSLIEIESDTSEPIIILPGEIYFQTTPQQDSAYFRALRTRIPSSTRFSLDLKRFETDIRLMDELNKGTPIDIARKNLDLPSEYFVPSPHEFALYELNQKLSTYVPYIRTSQPFGFKANLSDIGKILGLVEDVSPVLTYEVDTYTDVEVVVYSIQARVVATIFSGKQTPGKYTFTWNVRDDAGRLMPPGDYIGEIRIGRSKFIRKRIYIP
jgi:hypothetical protein